MKNCSNCEHHTWGDEWWNCKTECYQCRYTDRQGEKVPNNWKPLPMTNADRIRSMNDEELADFFFESPEIEFTVCEHCEYFDGYTSVTPCKHDMGRCFVSAKNKAFKKWLKQPAEQKVIKNYKKVVDK